MNRKTSEERLPEIQGRETPAAVDRAFEPGMAGREAHLLQPFCFLRKLLFLGFQLLCQRI
jgi:hypothetical protein